MTASAAARRPLLPPPVRAVLTALPRGITRLRHDPPPEPVALAGLVGLSLFALAVLLFLEPTVAPTETQVLPLILGGLLLGRRAFQWLSAVVAIGLAAEVVVIGLGLDGVRPGALVVTAVTGLIAHEFARAREETGLSGASGEGLLVELRQRLEQQGQLPVLPPMWRAEAVLRPAGGGPFAGDFVVSGLTDGGRTLELALVDVSGKGVAAGTRALLMSGALGGLLGAVPHDQFLPAANSYLNCQDWEEGFATAVHLILDLVTGEFAVESAGHPPAAQFDAGSGRWELLPTEGLALGLVPDVRYAADRGRLERGDALLLYTDGLVEVPGRDLAVGIDKLLGEADRLVPRGFAGGAELLAGRVAHGSTDDRGLVLVWRAA